MQSSKQGIFLFIVLTQVRSSHQQDKCFPSRKSEYGFALIGKPYKTISAKTFPECLHKCKEPPCMSVNFHLTKEECELNSQTKESRPTLYKKRAQSIYMANFFGRIPELQLGSQGKPAKSCLEILNKNESLGTGAHYWIDPSNTGTPIKVYCDMTTSGGGWTIVKRIILKSASIPPTSQRDHYYKALTSYTMTGSILFIEGAHMNAIRNYMGFNQIHFYCRKISVGRVVSIVTKNNTAGHQVLRYFTDDAWALNNFPDACGSFDRLPEDDSIISQTCEKWGRSRGGQWRVNKWGFYDAYGPNRINVMPFTSDQKKYGFGGYGGGPMWCDDGKISSSPNSAEDIWQIAER